MNTVHRGLKLVTSATALLTLLACIQGCEVEDDEFADVLNGGWTTEGPDGEVDRVVFDGEEVTFGQGTEDAYSCPYRVTSFSSKTRSLGVILTCKKRTGAVLPVAYQMQFRESKAAFSMFLEGRNVGEYEAVASR